MSQCLRFVLIGYFIGILSADETSSQCCVSKRFFTQIKTLTAELSKDGSSFTTTEHKYQLDYDYDMKMEVKSGTYLTDENGKKSVFSYTLINDYRKLKSYYLYNNSGACSVDNITLVERTPMCIPSTLRKTNSYIVGSGPGAFLVNSWEGQDGNITRSIQTSAYDCTPVSSTYSGTSPKGDRLVGSTLYGNYTQYRVSSADVFNIPTACMKAEQTIVG